MTGINKPTGYTKRMTDKQKQALLTAIADYMASEGCSCCQNTEKHQDAERRIAGLLNVPMYDDASGYDFNQFATNPVEVK